MIYILGMPTIVVVGTSLFQVIFVAANVTLLQSVQNQTVDVVLALVLTVGGVIGAQIGSRVVQKLPADQIRVLLAGLVLAVGVVLAWQLVATPKNVFSITTLGAPA
jgi:uncharacterized membrane protein YfcA